MSPMGAVRAGVFGSLSAVSSPRASSVKITRAAGALMNASFVPAKFSQPKCALHEITAGPVSERRPVTQPIKKQRKSNVTMAPFLPASDNTLLIYQNELPADLNSDHGL